MKTVKIDGEKLKEAFGRRNLSMEEVSVEMGYGKTFIRDCVRRGDMKLPQVKHLKSTFGIDYDEYKPDGMTGRSVKRCVEQPKVPEATSLDGLSEVIQSSIQSSIWSVFSNHREELEDMVASAFRKALEG